VSVPVPVVSAMPTGTIDPAITAHVRQLWQSWGLPDPADTGSGVPVSVTQVTPAPLVSMSLDLYNPGTPYEAEDTSSLVDDNFGLFGDNFPQVDQTIMWPTIDTMSVPSHLLPPLGIPAALGTPPVVTAPMTQGPYMPMGSYIPTPAPIMATRVASTTSSVPTTIVAADIKQEPDSDSDVLIISPPPSPRRKRTRSRSVTSSKKRKTSRRSKDRRRHDSSSSSGSDSSRSRSRPRSHRAKRRRRHSRSPSKGKEMRLLMAQQLELMSQFSKSKVASSTPPEDMCPEEGMESQEDTPISNMSSDHSVVAETDSQGEETPLEDEPQQDKIVQPQPVEPKVLMPVPTMIAPPGGSAEEIELQKYAQRFDLLKFIVKQAGKYIPDVIPATPSKFRDDQPLHVGATDDPPSKEKEPKKALPVAQRFADILTRYGQKILRPQNAMTGVADPPLEPHRFPTVVKAKQRRVPAVRWDMGLATPNG